MLVLRFRDLVTQPGDTIKLHQDIIEKDGYVYWGWWSKAGEKCPSIFLDYQLELAPLTKEIFLFDSGQSKLYKAVLSELKFDNSPSGMDCPDNFACAPEYYHQQKFKAWFKLGSIIEVKESEVSNTLQKYSYDDNNHGLFLEKNTFQDFFNKKVISLDELRHQDRTIWFFKHFENGHSEHEILLYNSNAVIPTVFPNNYVKVNDSKIHWVSDLHFSEGANQHGFNNQLLNSSLYSIIEKEFKYTLNALIVSGDMTWSASKDEFDQTVKFYTDLSSNTQLDLSKICFCPGNHDLSYQGTLTGEQKEALEKLHLLQRGEKITKEGGLEGRDNLTKDEISSLQSLETTEVAKDAYEQHFVTVTSAKPNEFLSMGKKFLINNQRAVEICLLNSNRMQQYKYLFQGNGFIGEDQRSDAAHEMGWTTSKGYGALRIVVLHHNLLPVEYSNIPYIGSSPGSYVYDSQATLKWCYKHDVDVILHGHTHQRSAMKLSDFDIKNNITKSVWIVGLGSTGVHHSHIVPTHTNQLAELDFSNKHIEIQFYDIVNNEVVRSGESLKLE